MSRSHGETFLRPACRTYVRAVTFHSPRRAATFSSVTIDPVRHMGVVSMVTTVPKYPNRSASTFVGTPALSCLVDRRSTVTDVSSRASSYVTGPYWPGLSLVPSTTTVCRTISTPASRSTSCKWTPQISARRIPVVAASTHAGHQRSSRVSVRDFGAGRRVLSHAGSWPGSRCPRRRPGSQLPEPGHAAAELPTDDEITRLRALIE